MMTSSGGQAAAASWTFPQAVHFANARQIVDQASAMLVRPTASAGVAAAAFAFDLSACASFDSSLLAILLELERRARTRGLSCRFASPPDKLLALAELYGVAPLLFVAEQTSGPSTPAHNGL